MLTTWEEPSQEYPVEDWSDAAESNLTEDFHKSDEWFQELEEKLQKPLADFQRGKFKRVKIAILDTGIHLCHDDFKEDEEKGTGNIFVKDFLPRASRTIPEANDEDGHGTHCAGLLRRVAPAADIYVAKIAHDKKSIDHVAVAKAINYAIDKEKWDVDIISISFGFRADSIIEETVGEAIAKAVKKKKLIFAATSNNGHSSWLAYPAWHPGVIAINSADADGKPSAFLPRDTADLGMFTALGEAVKSAWIRSNATPGETSPTRRMTGTSVATPIAAGIAALVLQAASIPCQRKETRDALARLYRRLKWGAVMRDVLKELSVESGGYRNLVPCDLARTELQASQVLRFLERVVAQKYKDEGVSEPE
ncbi:Peptidase S8/S53, subtilisin/kexin/sedolisin [Cordyceps fumosorosea ARSEF 2679]|uniref:Peptidase S8/S53, subtilisin/kexin/sedolisin n=1 Tax=Cordyceps fumosorosea (strain ARSEF 2679) TaxID=1081104 RepID=A0A168B8L5_CORFA|nr:Peptidase S8/S53, subtilisin/kexin/sedolisin [Cordyceps fumosorosea ARSEF 2679]OAA69771.1 Peptidase S8/S53, subtilisin/kexin/sedolisin [Cordyceps fumosorosea ARSEF 2679]